MALTRRQFVTRLGALAAAMGMSQVDLAKVTEAFAHGSAWSTGNWTAKPKVVWVHGAECTGCSTSLLSLFEDARGLAFEDTDTYGNVSTLAALNLAVGGSASTDKVLSTTNAGAGHPYGHRTIQNSATTATVDGTGLDFDNQKNANGQFIVNIADVLIDFIDLQYHETVMGMGGDLAYQYLKDLRLDKTAGASAPFVLVVEGAVQDATGGGYWNANGDAAWCSIGVEGVATGAGGKFEEHSFDGVVKDLAEHIDCAAVIAIGQCAAYGGYPGCKSPVLGAGQTGAKGVYDFLDGKGSAAKNKVVNVPGCPTNPWWFVLTVVAWLADYTNKGTSGGPLGIVDGAGALKASALDGLTTRRLNAVYGVSVHGMYCPRYQDFLDNKFAQFPGDTGCLQVIGCKGMSTNSLCSVHGWNSTNPHNDPSWENGLGSINEGRGSFCVSAGHPCMGCTEKGYPDVFVPFVARP